MEWEYTGLIYNPKKDQTSARQSLLLEFKYFTVGHLRIGVKNFQVFSQNQSIVLKNCQTISQKPVLQFHNLRKSIR